MKIYRLVYRGFLYMLVIGALFSCRKNLGNKGIFITDPQRTGAIVQSLTVDNTGGVLSITASSSHVANSAITIGFEADTSLVKKYNTTNGTNYKALPNRFFSLSANNAVMNAGATVSEAVTLQVSPFDASLNDGDLYMIPVKIGNVTGDMPVIEASRVVYVIINRVLINAALDMSSTSGISFAIPDPLTALTQFTVEMRVKVTGVFRNNMALFSAYPSEIYSRFGDVVIKPNQLQIKYAGVQPASTTEFSANRWYHIAYVFDGIANSFKIYVDGRLDGSTTAPANTKFDLQWMGFGVGPLQLQELRFWTKALNGVEIANGMCAVNPQSAGLYGYWKFNEGSGNTVADATGKGHKGTIGGTAKWVQGIRCPE